MATESYESGDETRVIPRGAEPPDNDDGKVDQTVLHAAASGLPDGDGVGIGSLLKQRFLLQQELGRGGMGIVYKALDLRRQEARDRDPYVAIKVLNPELLGDPQFLIALQRECKRSQNLPHPNIITVFDFDRDGACVFMTMEYLEGQALKDIIRARPDGMPLSEAWPWIKGMGDALSFAHDNQVVHSDFKPGNVYITPQNGVKVLDFGLASLVTRTHDQEQTLIDARVLGAYTPCYASLAVLQNEPPHPADDLYAFACTVYELLSGKHPYHRLTALQVRDTGVQPKRLDGLSGKQWRGLEHALALGSSEQRGTVQQLLAELNPNDRSNHGVAIAAVATLAVVIGAGIWMFDMPTTDHRSPEPTATQAAAPTAPAIADTATTADTAAVSAPALPEPALPEPQISPALLERLGDVRAISGDGLIAFGLPRSRFRIGEKLRLGFAVAKSTHVYVVYVNSIGEASQLYPNPYQPDRSHDPEQGFWVPPTSAPNFVLRIAKPAGRDRIVAIAAQDALDNPTAIAQQEAEPASGYSIASLDIDVTR